MSVLSACSVSVGVFLSVLFLCSVGTRGVRTDPVLN